MAQPQKFISLVDGRLTEDTIESVDASTGATDANKLLRLGSDGRLSETVLPTGVGDDAMSMPASENLAGGDFVNVWDDSGTASVRKADATAAGKEADGFVLDAVASGQPATVFFEGRNAGLTGLTVGARYYLSAAAPGAASTTPPAATGNVVQFLGRATTPTSLAFEATDGVILA
ncbi:MAG: hypothetical protein PHU77_00050 [Simplicispira sp.]|nr:hypothetical protein [Simplicispira sp.]